jgi:hypothetical protein
MTITIELEEEQVLALKAKAADGLTLEDWLLKPARHESILNPRPLKSATRRVGEIRPWAVGGGD